MIIQLLKPLILLVMLSSLLTSCLYRMPTEDDFHSVPKTNNPRFTRDRHSSLPGGAGY